MQFPARDVNIPYQSKTPTQIRSIQKASPQSASQSKLPRRITANPRTTQSTTQHGSARTLANEAKKDPRIECDKSNLLLTRKPLPSDKPLPARPIARVVNTVSPTKNSRCLIDASEQPLRMTSATGQKCEWPTLFATPSNSSKSTIPSSPSSPAEEGYSRHQFPEYSIAPRTSSATSSMERTLQRKETSYRLPETGHSSSSAVGARRLEPSAFVQGPGLFVKKTRHVPESPSPAFLGGVSGTPGHVDSRASHYDAVNSQKVNVHNPTYHVSLGSKTSDGSLLSTSAGSVQKATRYNGPTGKDSISPTSADSRPHSPSPASFSQPRPGSKPTTPASEKLRTASRIPIAGSKKATMVDVKEDDFSLEGIPQASRAASFGNRRLDAPGALQILDHGVRRRKLHRTPTDESPTQPREIDANESSSDETTPPTGSYSQSNSPRVSLAQNSLEQSRPAQSLSNEYWIPTRFDDTLQFTEKTASPTFTTMPANGNDENSTSLVGCAWPMKKPRQPPPTSQFTEPLQTIPSQNVLSLDDIVHDEEPNPEVVRTLSLLEGKGPPPADGDISHETLVRMFGQLQKSPDHEVTASMLPENAATAEEFLANEENKAPLCQSGGPKEPNRFADLEPLQKQDLGKKVASKWSSSTPSEKAASLQKDGLFPSQHPYKSEASIFNPSSVSQRGRSKAIPSNMTSIGHPSRLPAAPTLTTTVGIPYEHATQATLPRRETSFTTGKRQQGCSEPAVVHGQGYAGTTTSATSKKALELPTPIKEQFSVLDQPPRGRQASAEKFGAYSNRVRDAKTLRSRSKSRLMLDKMHGLFSGKREKKTPGQAAPPMPYIDGSQLSYNNPGSQMLEHGTRVPHLPKMPNLSPSIPLASEGYSALSFYPDDITPIEGATPLRERQKSIQVLFDSLTAQAQNERNPTRKERLLTFAKILNDALISAREAQISAETAQHAARSAQLSFEMTERSLAMLQTMAEGCINPKQ